MTTTTADKPKKTRKPVPLKLRIMPLDKLRPLIGAASDAERLELVEAAEGVISAVKEAIGTPTPERDALRKKLGV